MELDACYETPERGPSTRAHKVTSPPLAFARQLLTVIHTLTNYQSHHTEGSWSQRGTGPTLQSLY